MFPNRKIFFKSRSGGGAVEGFRVFFPSPNFGGGVGVGHGGGGGGGGVVEASFLVMKEERGS